MSVNRQCSSITSKVSFVAPLIAHLLASNAILLLYCHCMLIYAGVICKNRFEVGNAP